MTKRNLRNSDVLAVLILLNNDNLTTMAELNEQTVEITQLALVGDKTFKQIAAMYNLSESRVVEVYRKAVLKMARVVSRVVGDLDYVAKAKRDYAELKLRFDTLQEAADKFKIATPDAPCDFGVGSRPIFDLDLTERAFNCLKVSDINTIGELVKHTRKSLMKVRGMGLGSIDTIEEGLRKFGLTLKQL